MQLLFLLVGEKNSYKIIFNNIPSTHLPDFSYADIEMIGSIDRLENQLKFFFDNITYKLTY